MEYGLTELGEVEGRVAVYRCAMEVIAEIHRIAPPDAGKGGMDAPFTDALKRVFQVKRVVLFRKGEDEREYAPCLSSGFPCPSASIALPDGVCALTGDEQADVAPGATSALETMRSIVETKKFIWVSRGSIAVLLGGGAKGGEGSLYGGEGCAALGFILDAYRSVERRRGAERALLEEGERFRQSVENSPNPTFSVDRRGAIRIWNQACITTFGYEREDVDGVPMYGLIVDSIDRRAFEELVGQAFKDRAASSDNLSFRCKDGTILYTLSRVYPLFNERKVAEECVFTNTDVTDRKIAEEALRRSEERFKFLFEYAPVAYVLYDIRGNFIECNRAAEELAGIKRTELIGMNYLKSNLLSSGEVARMMLSLSKNAIGLPSGPDQFVLNRRDGSTVNIEILSYPIKFDNKKLVLGIAQDVTKRKKREEALRYAKELAESASRTKDEFLANMSHELRTPLHHIIGFTELLIREELGALNDAQKEFLSDMRVSGTHLLTLINDILDLSKVEAGKLNLKLSEVNLSDLLSTCIRVIEDAARKRQIRIETGFTGLPRRVTADEVKLNQIMYNLLANAVKFTPERGIIRVTAQPQRLERDGIQTEDGRVVPLPSHLFGGETTVDAVEVCVRDSGIGVRPENLERIFEDYEQVEPYQECEMVGTGLGLALTRKLVELHRGVIWAESGGEGKGAAFHFVIPTAQ